MEVTRDGNIASGRVGRLWLAASGRRPITDPMWRQYLEHSAASVKSEGPFHGVLLWSPTHGPSASQRQMLTEEFAQAVCLDVQRRVAVISASALVRGTMTAINWFTRSNIGAFAPTETARTLDWLAEDIAFDRSEAERTLSEIIREVEASSTQGRGNIVGV